MQTPHAHALASNFSANPQVPCCNPQMQGLFVITLLHVQVSCMLCEQLAMRTTGDAAKDPRGTSRPISSPVWHTLSPVECAELSWNSPPLCSSSLCSPLLPSPASTTATVRLAARHRIIALPQGHTMPASSYPHLHMHQLLAHLPCSLHCQDRAARAAAAHPPPAPWRPRASWPRRSVCAQVALRWTRASRYHQRPRRPQCPPRRTHQPAWRRHAWRAHCGCAGWPASGMAVTRASSAAAAARRPGCRPSQASRSVSAHGSAPSVQRERGSQHFANDL